MGGRIGLVGCVKKKQSASAPARDLYTSALFRGRRAFVERTCARWFILSAKHGLVDPSTVLEPYDETLKGAPTATRRTWSESVADQMRTVLGPLRGLTFEVHAGADYLDFGLERALLGDGADILRPTRGMSLGKQLAFYANQAGGTT
ncbi:MAG: DUF6884 domain-containing protein [Actinomycetota bacterium]